MSQAAGVHSIDAVRDFRAALCTFGEAATSAMASATLETQRFVDWIEHDQVKFWQGELRRREEQLMEAKSALARKRLAATFGDPPRDSEEQALLKKAIRRLEDAQEKLKKLAKRQRRFDRLVERFDANGDGVVSAEEAPRQVRKLQRFDRNGDGWLDRDELMVRP